MDDAAALATFISGTGYDDLPADVVEQARKLTLDYLAAGILGARSDMAPVYRDLLGFGGQDGGSTVLGSGAGRAPAPLAAALNAAYGHQVELAEGVSRAVVHCSNAVVPAALAVAEEVGASGRDYLRAVALGCEALIRWGYCLNSDPARPPDGDHPIAYRNGWWTPAALAPLGAATAATLLLGGDVAELSRSWGLATNLCPTATRELVHEGGSGKGMVLGIGCMNGVLAARLAHAGGTGSPDVLRGWLPLFGDVYDTARLSDGLGTTYEVGFVLYKYFATTGPIFASIEAVFALLDRYGPIPVQDITGIRIEGYRRTKEFHRAVPPVNPEAARSDTGYCVARALVSGDPSDFVEAAFTENAITDPTTLQLAGLVKVDVDPHYDSLYPKKAAYARLTVTLANGGARSVEVDRDAIPRYHNPQRSDTETKFRAAAAPALGDDKTRAAATAVWTLDSADTVHTLTATLS